MPQKPIRIFFNKGVQKPAKLGTVILKPTSQGKLAYAQNVQANGLEYGEGVLVPGPAVVTVTTNSQLTGIPIGKAFNAFRGMIHIIEGALGNTDRIRTIKNVTAGSTPDLDTTANQNGQVSHSTHTGETITDIAARAPGSAVPDFYVVGKDDTDGWVFKWQDSTASSVALVTVLSNFLLTQTPKILAASDNFVYIFHGKYVDALDTSDTYTIAASGQGFVLPANYGTTEVAEWNNTIAIAYSTASPFDISQRKNTGESGIVLWDMISKAQFVRDVKSPSRYISALANRPNGSLIAFGSLDAGITTIYNFTGYGFEELYSYIGEPPRNRHSVEFDAQGNMLWQTLDGQICSFNFATGEFNHIASLDTTAGYGGIFGRLLGGSGNEFIAASGKTGTPNTFTAARITQGNYIGDADNASDVYNTPKAVSGLEFLPPNSTITAMTMALTKKLASGEKVKLKLFKNGDTTPADYFSMDYSVDGAVSSKRKAIPVIGIHNFALGVVYKQVDAASTAPPLMYVDVEWTDTIN